MGLPAARAGYITVLLFASSAMCGLHQPGDCGRPLTPQESENLYVRPAASVHGLLTHMRAKSAFTASRPHGRVFSTCGRKLGVVAVHRVAIGLPQLAGHKTPYVIQALKVLRHHV